MLKSYRLRPTVQCSNSHDWTLFNSTHLSWDRVREVAYFWRHSGVAPNVSRESVAVHRLGMRFGVLQLSQVTVLHRSARELLAGDSNHFRVLPLASYSFAFPNASWVRTVQPDAEWLPTIVYKPIYIVRRSDHLWVHDRLTANKCPVELSWVVAVCKCCLINCRISF